MRASRPTRRRPKSRGPAIRTAACPPRPTTRPERRRPVAVAVTGGIGAGKSEALRAFARHGAEVVSSDDIVHELLRSEPKVREALVERLGEGILAPGGEIDRARVAEIVFASPEDLAWLERLLHPRVAAAYLRWREDLSRRDEPPAVCATEVPLLYEVGAERHFDAVVVVTASPEVRIARRLRAVDERERRLLPDAEKAARADFVYENDGTLAELDAFVAGVVERLSA